MSCSRIIIHKLSRIFRDFLHAFRNYVFICLVRHFYQFLKNSTVQDKEKTTTNLSGLGAGEHQGFFRYIDVKEIITEFCRGRITEIKFRIFLDRGITENKLGMFSGGIVESVLICLFFLAPRDQQPATTSSQPATTSSQPATTSSQPATTSSQPATTNSQPAT